MSGSNYTSQGLNIIDDYASLSTEIRWLISAFGGIIMCKVAYEFTGIVTSFLLNGFINLTKAQQLEWKNRGFSTFHAIFVASASLYLLLVSDLFYENSNEESFIKRRSTLSDTILGMSSGYFLSDMAMIIWTYPTLGGFEYILHHGLSMYAIMQSVLTGEAEFYIFMVLFTESTTPFVNLRWHLDVAGMKSSKLYLLNGIAMFLGWLVARIVLFGFFFHHIYNHIDEVRQVKTAAFCSLLTIPPRLFCLQLIFAPAPRRPNRHFRTVTTTSPILLLPYDLGL